MTRPCTFTMISIYMYLLNTDKKSDFKFSTIFSRNSTFKKYHVNVHVNHMHVFLSVTWYYRFSDEAGDDDIPITSCLQKSLGVGGGGTT